MKRAAQGSLARDYRGARYYRAVQSATPDHQPRILNHAISLWQYPIRCIGESAIL